MTIHQHRRGIPNHGTSHYRAADLNLLSLNGDKLGCTRNGALHVLNLVLR